MADKLQTMQLNRMPHIWCWLLLTHVTGNEWKIHSQLASHTHKPKTDSHFTRLLGSVCWIIYAQRKNAKDKEKINGQNFNWMLWLNSIQLLIIFFLFSFFFVYVVNFFEFSFSFIAEREMQITGFDYEFCVPMHDEGDKIEQSQRRVREKENRSSKTERYLRLLFTSFVASSARDSGWLPVRWLMLQLQHHIVIFFILFFVLCFAFVAQK